uniref:Uncharacterized protein n=1 Tax=Oncorhynchus tshawytscha TaxID=74940 RepID=A0A8C8IXU9_ONCTS
SADISKCCTETQPKTPNSKQCRCRSTVARKNDTDSVLFHQIHDFISRSVTPSHAAIFTPWSTLNKFTKPSMLFILTLIFVSYPLQCDRLAADTAIELRRRGVASLVSQLIIVEKDSPPGIDPKVDDKPFDNTTELSGKCIVELAKENLMSLSGNVLTWLGATRCQSVTDHTSFKFLLTQVLYLSWLS